jgi:hypothetical protein
MNNTKSELESIVSNTQKVYAATAKKELVKINVRNIYMQTKRK